MQFFIIDRFIGQTKEKKSYFCIVVYCQKLHKSFNIYVNEEKFMKYGDFVDMTDISSYITYGYNFKNNTFSLELI